MITLLQLRRNSRDDFAQIRRIQKLDGANGLEILWHRVVQTDAVPLASSYRITPSAHTSDCTLECPVTNCSGAM